MKVNEDFLEKILVWAQSQTQIKVIILEGSIGSGTAKDKYSDFDINLFVEDINPFTESDEWFEQFDNIVVFQKEGTYYRSSFIPARLVIYQNSPRVDFSFWPISILKGWIVEKELPEFYKNGYKVLLDELGITDQLIKPTNEGYRQTKPSNDQFLKTIFNFYFEASIIAKYLYRKNLWFAIKLSNGPIKDFLQQMIMWQTAEKEDWNLKGMNSLGKNLEEKISVDIESKFDGCFSKYDVDDSWKSLYSMIDFFEQISNELSSKLGIAFPEKKIENVMNYIDQIHRRS
jgi:aminoglycoside 6-adenylyltransferase